LNNKNGGTVQSRRFLLRCAASKKFLAYSDRIGYNMEKETEIARLGASRLRKRAADEAGRVSVPVESVASERRDPL
jgi:hypothetical protein